MKRWMFFLVVLFQVLFLTLMSASFYTMDLFGETVRLKTTPVDPRDPFYGDYVTLSYEVEQVPKSKWIGNHKMERGEPIYLLLEPDKQGVHQLVKASDQSFIVKEGQVMLSGKYQYQSDNFYRVEIGLNRYYIEENSGEKFDRNPAGRVVEIVLAPWGQKKISSLE